MKRKKEQYRMSRVKLMGLARQTVPMIERDLEKFERYGFTRTDYDLYVEKVKVVEELDQKIEKQIAMLVKEKRNVIMDDTLLMLNDLDLTLRLKYGLQAKEYKLFNLHRFKYLTGKNLHQRVAVILDLKNSEYAYLLNECMSPERQLELAQKNTELGEIVINLENTLGSKKLKNDLHVEKYNELYKETLRIRQTGKKMWALTDYALSKMYAMPKRRKKRKKTKDK